MEVEAAAAFAVVAAVVCSPITGGFCGRFHSFMQNMKRQGDTLEVGLSATDFNLTVSSVDIQNRSMGGGTAGWGSQTSDGYGIGGV